MTSSLSTGIVERTGSVILTQRQILFGLLVSRVVQDSILLFANLKIDIKVNYESLKYAMTLH